MARLDRMGPAKRVAQLAAVVGQDFDESLIADVLVDDRHLVPPSLKQLVAERVLVATPQRGVDCYSFRHALLRDAAYHSLLRRTRRDLHAKVARTLHERLDDGGTGVVEEQVARHYEAAGEPAIAAQLYRAAAAQAAARAAHRERAAHLVAAERLLAESAGDEAARCDVLVELGDARWMAGEYEPARTAFREAATLAERLESPARLAQAALGFAGRMGYGAGAPNQELIDLLETSLGRLDPADTVLRAAVTARLAQALTFADDAERRFALADTALELARRQDDPAVTAAVDTDVHWAVWGPDTLDLRLALARDAIARAEQAVDVRLEAEGRMWLVSDLMEASDVAAARAELDRWAALAEQLQDNYQLWAVAVTRAMFSLLGGSLDEGEQLALRALGLAGEGYNENAFQLFGVQISNIRREQGRWPELEEPLKQLVAGYRAIPTWRAALAAMYAEAGRVAEAQGELDVLAVDDFACFRKDVFWLANTMLAADTCSIVGDVARANVLYRQLAPYPRRAVMPAPFTACWGSTSRSLAILARAAGEPTLAEAHFEDAVGHNTELGATPALARTLVEYAQLLFDGGSRERGVELAGQARDLARDAGLPVRYEQAGALLEPAS
jgi:hypothetical protein